MLVIVILLVMKLTYDLMVGMTICNRPLFHWFRREIVRDNLSLSNAEDDSDNHGEYSLMMMLIVMLMMMMMNDDDS